MNNNKYIFVKSNLLKHIPVIVFKSDYEKRDVCIPFVSSMLGMPLIKIGFNRLNNPTYSESIDVVNSVLKTNIKRDTILWIKELNLINGNLFNFINDVIKLSSKNSKWFIIFSGPLEQLSYLSVAVKSIIWDDIEQDFSIVQRTDYGNDYCVSKIKVPQIIHFRVYNNILNELRKVVNDTSNIYIGNGEEKVPVSSIISTMGLNLCVGHYAKIYSALPINIHQEVVEAILIGWNKEVPLIDTTQHID
jgi:hypothetical protein